MVRSDSKIDEDWERKLRERERREYGERERERKWHGEGFVFAFKERCCYIRKLFNRKNMWWRHKDHIRNETFPNSAFTTFKENNVVEVNEKSFEKN